MKLLLDTCTFIWLAGEPNRLSKAAAEAIDNEENQIFLSDVSVWEICVKWRSGKLTLLSPPRIWIEEQRAHWILEELKIEKRHVYRTTELDLVHQDPFDRLLISQSIEEGIRIVTPDNVFLKYPVAVVWR